MSQPSQYLGALVGDIASAFQIPGGSVLGQCIQDLFKKRLEAARNILLEEIRQGTKDVYEAHEVDDVVAIVYRYMRAAQEGTAQTNLRLLARIIAGQKAAGASKASDFLYYADIIASLRHEEIVFLGTACRINQESKESLSIEENNAYLMNRLNEELVPSVFSERIDLHATAGALTRTGLIVISSAGFGGTSWIVTSLMDKLRKMASFDDLIMKDE